MSVRRAMQEIDSREFSHWRALDRIDPIGPYREDLRAGIVAAAVVNATCRPDEPMTAEEFLPRWKRADAEPSPEELKAKIEAAFGVKRGAKK